MEIKENYLTNLTFTYVKEMYEVIDFALLPEKVSKPIDLSVTVSHTSPTT
jgi:hypothetical protein